MPRTKAPRAKVPKSKDAVSKKALKNSEFTYWGDEPTWNPLLNEAETMSEMANAMNWYTAMSDEKQKKRFLVEYAEKHFPKEADSLRRVSEDSFICGEGHVAGILSRCVMRGAKLPDKWKHRLASSIRNFSKSIPESSSADEEVVEKRAERNPKVAECIGIVNGMLDDYGLNYTKKNFPDVSMADAVLKAGATNGQRLKVYEHFAPLILELKQVSDGSNKDLKEAYEGYSKTSVKRVYTWLTGQPSDDLVAAARTSRKPRKKKEKTPAQILKRFSYKGSDDSLKITSIDPEGIIGAQQLWVFNTKTRRLGVYYAKDEKGLNVSRKSITDYDEATSINKKIRKPNEVVPVVITAGKVALRHLLDNIRATATPMKCRISEDVLLLRVVK